MDILSRDVEYEFTQCMQEGIKGHRSSKVCRGSEVSPYGKCVRLRIFCGRIFEKPEIDAILTLDGTSIKVPSSSKVFILGPMELPEEYRKEVD